MKIQEYIDRHTKIALQFSGGKDSLATLYLLKPWWDKLTVYWLNPGNLPVETLFQMGMIRELVPSFIEVKSNSAEVIEKFGYPSDVVPSAYTLLNREIAKQNRPFLIQDRTDCCLRSIMLPLHERMVADGITLIIRGQRNAEVPRGPLHSGQIVDGFEFLFPIEDWSTEHVMDYLQTNRIAVPNFYLHGEHGVDCLHCSAYWEKKPDKYLKVYYPAEYKERKRRIMWIRAAVSDTIQELIEE